MSETKRPRGGAGNFAVNRERAVEAGRKGGQASGGNFAKDRSRAVEAGRKGGRASQARSSHANAAAPAR